MIESSGERWLRETALRDPDLYDRLLRGYHRLLGTPPWWRDCAEAQHPRWRECIRATVRAMAAEQHIAPRVLAHLLDEHGLPRARARIIATASALLAEVAA